jgi:hypothetical protein
MEMELLIEEMQTENKSEQEKHISYCCDVCNYKSKCNIDIQNHNCNPTSNDETRIQLEKQLGILKIQLLMERCKAKIYINIIKQNTSIDIDDIDVSDMGHEISLCHQVIPLTFHDCNNITNTKEKIPTINTVERDRDEVKKQSKPRRTQTTHISKLREDNDSKINIDEIQVQFEDVFNDIEQTKIPSKYNKYLTELKNRRLKLFSSFSNQDYMIIIQKHIGMLESMFKSKEITDKKAKTLVLKSLSPLESRLISYQNYQNTSIEVDEIEMMLGKISSFNKDIHDYVPFNIDRLMKKMSSYSCALFSFDALINHMLFNPNGYNNYVYFQVKSERRNDLFSFYYLDSITKGKRNWKMDCRLESLTTNIVNIILPYMISMFRKLYKDTFQDNTYRSNYSSISQLMEIDCEQLFKNIFLIGHQKHFRNYLINKLAEKAPYVQTENDKFNILTDDALQRNKFKSEKETDFREVIITLFDDIGFDDIVELYRTKKLSYSQDSL